MIEESASSSATRRDLIGAGGAALLATGAVVIAGCGAGRRKRKPPESTLAVASSDVPLLNRLLDLEHATIAAYTAGIPLLNRSAAKASKQFLGQELTHAGELSGLIRRTGVKPHKPGPSYDLGHPKTAHDVLALVHQLERAQIAAYLDTIPKLSPGKVRGAAAALLANDAQHVAILRGHLGLPEIPSALLTNTE